MASFLAALSALSTPVIAGCGVVHVLFFLGLGIWYRREVRALAAALEAFTRGWRHRSVLTPAGTLTDQLEAFIADVRELLDRPLRDAERQEFLKRILTLDEQRTYLRGQRFDAAYHVARTMIEAYPLAGVLGTILALGVVLQGEAEGSATVQELVRRFGEAIWSTCAGLVTAIVLMFLNSLVEVPFVRLSEARQQVRETVLRSKRSLAWAEPPGAEAARGGPA